MNSAVILIPARYASTRFPGKPLAMIRGKSMIERVYRNCQASGLKTFVVTDNDQIEQAVRSFGGEVLRVDDDVPSGSERIALAYERFLAHLHPELVINVQGDEPLLQGETLSQLARFHLTSSFDIATMVRERNASEEDFSNPNVVKAVVASETGRCLYFSRQSLPFNRDQQAEHRWHQHIGVYSYRPQALSQFVKLPASRLENLEKLEQLRALENNFSIGALTIGQELIGVDTPEDVIKVEGVLRD
jgi:3-deoxy-manno-octulosonate cytidylyltransferase (CMP-KDO synthetase)